MLVVIHVLGVVLPVMYRYVRGFHVLGVVLSVMYKCVMGYSCFRSSFTCHV